MKNSQGGYEGDAPRCWDCGDDPIENLRRMFVDIVQTRRVQKGQNPALRPVFLKPHGIAHGNFEMRKDLPAGLKVGVFGRDSLSAWVRFSSDTLPTVPDLETTLGVGIKLFGLPGKKLLGDGDTQDFILQNFDVFFVDTAKDFCEFTKAGVVNGDYQPYLDAHPKTDQILNQMKRVESSVLSTTYWSVLPYSFGQGRYVKYKLEPELEPERSPFPMDPNYLALDLGRRLRDGEARFRFMVQLRTNTMPIDQATVRWSEQESAPIHVATLVLPRQEIDARGQSAYGENLAFNPWHCLPEHQPQGSVSEARRVVYEASSVNRRNINGVPAREPDSARPARLAAGKNDQCIVRAAIHPSIGIARVGNSEEGFFLGPEVTEPLRESPGFYRDQTGALKRQAARFRVYGVNAEGNAVMELTCNNSDIRWTVHLANKKAAWYQFQIALDIPEADSAPPSLQRNASIGDRSKLIIDPGPRDITGRDAGGGPAYTFDTGRFMDEEIYLGELRTDSEGHLIVLGGRGKSASFDRSRAVTFANNEGWHDDVSDGPVTAEVSFQGKKLTVDPAWVVVGPPNYAPMQKSVRTMWDLIRDVHIQAGTLSAPVRPSFEYDIRPILERLSQLQWVNAGFAAAFGWKSPNELSTPYWLSRLSANAPVDQELRETIANHFRVFERDAWSPTPWPWLYGDAMNIPPAQTPRQNATLTGTQLKMLQQWAASDFDADYNAADQPRKIEEVPIPERPAMLDRAALEFCLADAFHPGCEMTWPMRTAGMYAAPFRLLHAPAAWIEPQYGAALTSDVITLPSGPLLGGQLPGGITRWMAVPWQTDTASCRSGYLKTYDPYVPSFWPARVPNQVLTEENYAVVIDEKRPLGERMAAFAARAAWIRPLGSKSYTDQINNLVKDISQMGIVEGRDGPKGDSGFPAVIQVEQLPPHTHRFLAEATAAGEHPEAADQIDLTGIEKVRRFPYGLLRRL